MKINPIGIQSYQQVTNRQTAQTLKADEQKDTNVVDKKVTIPAQDALEQSKVAVKVNSGSYAEFLSTEERQALDILFSKFKDVERFNGSYRADTPQTSKAQTLGANIDLKV